MPNEVRNPSCCERTEKEGFLGTQRASESHEAWLFDGIRGAIEASLPGLVEQLCHEASPAGLMAGAQSRSSIAVKIFVKQNQVPPPGIILKFFKRAIHGPPSLFIPQKNVRQGT